MAVFSPIQAVLFTYPPARFQGMALAAGLGWLNGMGVTGGFVGPSVMGLIEKATGQAFGRAGVDVSRPGRGRGGLAVAQVSEPGPGAYFSARGSGGGVRLKISTPFLSTSRSSAAVQ